MMDIIEYEEEEGTGRAGGTQAGEEATANGGKYVIALLSDGK